ncbi:universal stress protein [Myroides sp. LJL116]
MNKNKALDILVGLDLSFMDKYLIEYLEVLDSVLNIQHITFVHNIKITELSKDFLTQESISLIKERIQQNIEQQVAQTKIDYTFSVEIGLHTYSELAFIELSKKKLYDMLILGNKQHLSGNGALAQKLIRILPLATLLVPETFNKTIATVIDAIDFSKYTPIIMNWADRFKNNDKNLLIEHTAVHISKFSWGFYAMITDNQFEKASKQDILEKQQKWNKTYSNYTKIDVVGAKDQNVPAALMQYASDKHADLLILGVKGYSSIKEIFLGSVANHVLQRPTNTCLLFVKEIKK